MIVFILLCLPSLVLPMITWAPRHRRQESENFRPTTQLGNESSESNWLGSSETPRVSTTTQSHGENEDSNTIPVIPNSWGNLPPVFNDPEITATDTDSKCTIDYCELFDICESQEICVTTPECNIQCLKNESAGTIGSSEIPRVSTTTQSHGENKDSNSIPVIPWGNLPPVFKNPELNTTDTDSKCSTDYCEIFKICDGQEICVTTPECNIQCLKNESAGTNAGRMLPSENTTLRPISERSCDGSDIFVCRHGRIGDCSESSIACDCDEGWTGAFCTDRCDLPCVHGQCHVFDNTMVCNCEYQYTGKRCDELIPDPKERSRILAAILASALAVVVLLAIIIPVIMWRMRVIFVLKLVYFFKEYEDDDGKMYDAYVSMTPTATAENFVYKSLQPRLESENFKIYLQARDAPAGEAISETILSALENSRRTIMIITPDYIRNEWNRFEYLIAQQETLKLQQRIIPIILEDIEKEDVKMDKSLKHILASIKCLKFPEAKQETVTSNVGLSGDIQSPDSNRTIDSTAYIYTDGRSNSTDSVSKEEQNFQKKVNKFWKRLILTMPKKKTQENKSLKCFAKLGEHVSYDISTVPSEKNANRI